jgi:hypothetical protein
VSADYCVQCSFDDIVHAMRLMNLTDALVADYLGHVRAFGSSARH